MAADLSDKSSLEHERIIIEAGILAVTLLFIVAQFKQDWGLPVPIIPWLSANAFFFILAAMIALVPALVPPLVELHSVMYGVRFASSLAFYFGLLMLLITFLLRAQEIQLMNYLFLLVVIWISIFSVALGLLEWHSRKNRPPFGPDSGED